MKKCVQCDKEILCSYANYPNFCKNCVDAWYRKQQEKAEKPKKAESLEENGFFKLLVSTLQFIFIKAPIFIYKLFYHAFVKPYVTKENKKKQKT